MAPWRPKKYVSLKAVSSRSALTWMNDKQSAIEVQTVRN
jgi:hypothetical protein